MILETKVKHIKSYGSDEQCSGICVVHTYTCTRTHTPKVSKC